MIERILKYEDIANWYDGYRVSDRTLDRCLRPCRNDLLFHHRGGAPESVERSIKDPLKSPTTLGIPIPDYAEAALLKALTVDEENRYKTMEAFKNDIQNGEFLNKKKEIQKEQERIRREKERALQEEQEHSMQLKEPKAEQEPLKAEKAQIESEQETIKSEEERKRGEEEKKKSYEKAYEWYMKAAEQGNPAAQTSLGTLYRDGLGVEQSDEKAIEWFTKAAEQGDEDAKSCLEEMN